MGKQIAEETFSKLDINHSGTLEFSEFVTFGLQQQYAQREARLKEAFKLFDRDGSGKISK
jgi:calcium-dependent protein kinase